MNEETQDLAWAVLPKEYREKVKETYRNETNTPADKFRVGAILTFERLFGRDNLTSDTEPTELLFVERKKVQDVYAFCSKRAKMVEDKITQMIYEERARQVARIFGEKCLPDEEPTDLSTQDKETMEEKELDLTQLLKGCEGETFYTPICGECKYNGTAYEEDDYPLQFIATNKERGFGKAVVYFDTNGLNRDNGIPLIFPSRTLYEKYPLDAYSAWMKWKSERSPKRWRAEYGETYYALRDNFTVCDQYENNDSMNDDAWDNYNYFRTEEEAQQAAEAVRECLAKFNENQSKQ